jgi:hypothetical protein
MKILVGILLLLVATGVRADPPAGLDTVFQQGTDAYEAGDYPAAITLYQDLVSGGVANADLFYNLGNAYFEMDDLGHAVLWYERTLGADPRHEDAAANLTLARSMLRDQQLLVPSGGLRNAALVWHQKTTAAESVAVASGFYLLFCVLAVLFVFRREPAVGDFLKRMSIVSPGRLFGLGPGPDVALAMAAAAVVGLLFAGSAWTKIRSAGEHTRGVIVTEEVAVFSGPSRDATVQFKVHQGTGVSVRESRPGWIRVELPGDLSGWVDAGALERI